jgi:hypothetical protein
MIGHSNRVYFTGQPHGFYRVARWINGTLPEGASVGSAQAGIIGYFCEHVSNLDGKVSHEVYRALHEKQFAQYMSRKRFDYVIDQGFVIGWFFSPLYPRFLSDYELIHEINAGGELEDFYVFRRVPKGSP